MEPACGARNRRKSKSSIYSKKHEKSAPFLLDKREQELPCCWFLASEDRCWSSNSGAILRNTSFCLRKKKKLRQHFFNKETYNRGASSPPHFFCTQNQDFSRVWIRLSLLLPKMFDCFAWQISRVWNDTTSLWSEKPGVTSRPGAGFDAINWLDPADALTRRETVYFAYTTAALTAAGWNSTTRKLLLNFVVFL